LLATNLTHVICGCLCTNHNCLSLIFNHPHLLEKKKHDAGNKAYLSCLRRFAGYHQSLSCRFQAHTTTSISAATMICIPLLWTFSLVLQFDGSFRPPKDFGFPTDSMRKLPSCSSAILADGDEQVLALGGKLIPFMPGMTSADAEYDGLLVGLEWLGKQEDDWWTKHASSKTLTIRGDNKAIIDQLSGSALPRKLLSKHEYGQSIFDNINKHL